MLKLCSMLLPRTVVRSPHEQQLRESCKEGVPDPGGHGVGGWGPDQHHHVLIKERGIEFLSEGIIKLR